MNMPGMVDLYRDMAITWQGDICELVEEDHVAINDMWNNSPKRAKINPCNGCRGI